MGLAHGVSACRQEICTDMVLYDLKMPLFPSPANFIWKDYSAWCPKCHRQKKSFFVLFLKNHFLTQGFGLSMHKIYKKKKTYLGKTSMATPSSSSGDQSCKERHDRHSQPLSITAKKQMCLADALDSNGHLAQDCLHLFHRQPHTYPDRSNQIVSLLSIYTLNWADWMFHYPP